MRGDYSKIPFNEKKRRQHYRKAYLPQGKVLLDSDLNENTDLLQYQTKAIAEDAICLCGSPNNGFRIGSGIPLLPVDDTKGWSAEPSTASLAVDYFEKFEGKGSLKLVSAKIVVFTAKKPFDLSRYRWIRLIIRGEKISPNVEVVSEDAPNNPKPLNWISEKPINNGYGYTEIKYSLSEVTGLDKIIRIILKLSSYFTYHIGAVECGPPMFTLDPMGLIEGWSYTEPDAQVSITRTDGDGTAIKATRIKALHKKQVLPVDFGSYEKLEFVIKYTGSIKFYMTDSKGNTSNWTIDSLLSTNNYLIEMAKPDADGNKANIASIIEYGFSGLEEDKTYYFGRILYEMSLEKNFVIAGMDVLTGETGRLYVSGDLYEKEEAETYLNQKNYPLAPKIYLRTGKKRKDLVYADVWQRHVTPVEDSGLREVALGGPDTCNRMKAVAQVKLLIGIEKDSDPQEPVLNTTDTGRGRLSTLVDHTSVTLNPCEITPEAEYTGWENRLYRVEIHDPGIVGKATYKWSRNNAATISPILNNVPIGSSSFIIKDTRLFSIGDIIEISDDIIELSDKDKNAWNEPTTKRMGELRQIIDIDQDENKLYLKKGVWGYTAEGVDTAHPLVRKWDGTDFTNDSEIQLEDGVWIKFSGTEKDIMRTGDYWTFTTRVNTREIEKLDNELPHGVVHRYCPLAVIERDENGIVSIEDKRVRFEPLCGLNAADIGFDRANIDSFGEDVKNVQQAIESIVFPEYLTCGSLTLNCDKNQDVSKNPWPKLKCDQLDMVFLTGDPSTERMRIKTDGKFGIGTVSPNNILNVQANSNDLTAAQLEIGPTGPKIGESPSSSFVSKLRFRSTFDEYPTDQNPRVSAQIVSGFAGGTWGKEYLTFQVGSDGASNDSSNDPKEKMRILGNGYVGIGTDNPLHKLTIDADATGGWASNAGKAQLALRGATKTALRLGLGVDTTKENARIQAAMVGTGAVDLLIQPGGGNVGIGTIDPLYRLHVNNSGNFGDENDDGTSKKGNVPLVLQADGTVFGFLNKDSRQAFALNLEGNESKISKRGYPVFYDKYDGSWHSSIYLRNGNVGMGEAYGFSRLTVKGRQPYEVQNISGLVKSDQLKGDGTSLIGIGNRIQIGEREYAETKVVTSRVDNMTLIVNSPFDYNHQDENYATVYQSLFGIEDSGGKVKLLISDEGKVGIGTISPIGALHIKSSENVPPLIVEGSNIVTIHPSIYSFL